MKLRNSKIWFACMVCMGLLLTACGGDDAGEGGGGSTTAPTASKPVVTAIDATSAVVSSTVTGSGITGRGICYGTTANPTVNDKKVTATTNTMSVTLTGLTASTTYHVRAYVQTSSTVVYSDNVSFTTTAEATPDLSKWVAPTYVDDYRSLSTWEQRSKWNLANVHDPSVVKADDGYYYMYCTDAGYGDPQNGHGHFHCRRSTDLVNWEYIGASMPSTPSRVMPKLNEIRKEMGLGNSSAGTNYGYWAPCVRKVRSDLYRMYYCIVVPGTINGNGTWSERAFIGLMETADLQE